MADIINVPTYEQIETILSRLATNYSNMASVFYDVFYNTEAMDVTFKMFDESGVLQTYTIPNRAKDMQNVRSGEGSPEGILTATMGVLYQDLQNGTLYIKETPSGNDGWSQIATEDYLNELFLRGMGSPEGVVSAPKGVLYIDVNSASLYIKTTITGTSGWTLLSMDIDASALANTDLSNLSPTGQAVLNQKVNVSLNNLSPAGQAVLDQRANVNLSNLSSAGQAVLDQRANKDLSNLSPTGQALFNQKANIDLDNLSTTGQALFNAKEDISNKVTTISESSTDTEYPSAKCVYDLLGDVEALINAL